jgi:alkylglycerol monooxygenase
MQGINYIVLSIPVFFILMAVEWAIARYIERDVYRLNDSINDLHCGILQQVLGVFSKVVEFSFYVAIFEAWRRFEIPGAPWAWVVCFLLVDHQYYWFHRVSHEINLPWGAHIVHHSSEEFNLAVALRQGSFQQFFSFVFYLPLAWLGFPPLMFLACSSFNTLYQFWIHTRLIKRLGPIEWVFNTPSHHRVHHGCDDKYLDKNYAGTLIVWDRLYGSFQEEEEEPTYGVTRPLASWNPVWANFHYYADLLAMSRMAPNWSERLKVWVKGPSWKPAWKPDGPGRAPERSPLLHGPEGRYDARAPQGLTGYLVTQFLGLIAVTVVLLFGQEHFSWPAKLALALFIAWTATNVGALFEARRWVLPSELARLAAGPILAVAVLGAADGSTTLAVAIAGSVLAFALAAWLLRYRHALAPAPAAAQAAAG